MVRFNKLSIRPLGGWRRDTGLIVDKKLVLSYNKGSIKYVVSDSTVNAGCPADVKSERIHLIQTER